MIDHGIVQLYMFNPVKSNLYPWKSKPTIAWKNASIVNPPRPHSGDHMYRIGFAKNHGGVHFLVCVWGIQTSPSSCENKTTADCMQKLWNIIQLDLLSRLHIARPPTKFKAGPLYLWVLYNYALLHENPYCYIVDDWIPSGEMRLSMLVI